jgi:hypothetical protein
MKERSFWRYVPPAGPILSLLLIGLVLLSALLYYRAIKIQRFLEPALAMSQPRNEFNKRIQETFRKEFGPDPLPGLSAKAGSLFMHKSLLFTANDTVKPSGHAVVKKIARIFHTLLSKAETRAEIGHIVIITRFPPPGPRGGDVRMRMNVQLMAGFIQEALFRAEPELETKYASFFTSGSQLLNSPRGSTDLVEFQIIPSEFLHIEVLEKLEKYAY